MTAIGRRPALLALAASLAGCAGLSAADAVQAKAMAPGVYVVPGSGGAPDESNLGRTGNAGFVVGSDGVVVIDTGASLAHGRALLQAIASATDRPVKLAIVTHTQPEFLFGGGAFRERGIPVAMHARCAGLMASRCELCLRRLRQAIGEAPFTGTEMYRPDRVFEATHRLDDIGRPLVVLHLGHSSGPGDVAVFDEASGVLFAGGLLEAGRVPDIEDGRFDGWQAALKTLRALPVKQIVPAHGPVSPPALIDQVSNYLAQLDAVVRRYVSGGGSLLEVADGTELPAFAAWDQYAVVHRRNAAVAYLRVERELLFQ